MHTQIVVRPGASVGTPCEIVHGIVVSIVTSFSEVHAKPVRARAVPHVRRVYQRSESMGFATKTAASSVAQCLSTAALVTPML